MNYLVVFLGGGFGSLLRFLIALLFSKTNLSLPYATLSSNVLSCLMFASVLYVYQDKNMIPDSYKHFILIGICGGLSTFSTFSFETFELLKQGLTVWAFINIAVSCILCTAIFFAFTR